MRVGYLGLGKMGLNMVSRLLENKIDVIAWNRSPEPRQQVAAQGAAVSETVVELVKKLPVPRVIWLMLPAGKVVDEMINELAGLLDKNDIVIDGGNSFYQDSIRHAKLLGDKAINFLDVGVSGGPSGARNGACLMIGGDSECFQKLHQLWQAIATTDAYAYVGRAGAGHFAKMVHNGIEYGMMEAVGEGAAVLKESPFAFDLGKVFQLYNRQSVIASRLVGWAEEAFQEDARLTGVSSVIAASGEGEWTVKEAKELNVHVPVIEQSLAVRNNSKNDDPGSPDGFRNQVVSALRGKFGGHKVRE